MRYRLSETVIALLTINGSTFERYPTIRSLEDARLRNKIKVIVGGAPVTQEFADKIGADAYGKDAWDAVIKAEKLLSNCL